MQNASAPSPDLQSNNVIIEEVPPGQSQDTENEVPQQSNDNEVPPENETPRTEIFSSYEDQGRIPPPFNNHQVEDLGTE